jgi:lysozyme family protein
VNLLSVANRSIPVDGKLGPMTIARANELDPEWLLDAIREFAAERYRAIVKKNPTQERFLRGWLRRAYD